MYISIPNWLWIHIFSMLVYYFLIIFLQLIKLVILFRNNFQNLTALRSSEVELLKRTIINSVIPLLLWVPLKSLNNLEQTRTK